MKKLLLILPFIFSCNQNTEDCFCTEEYIRVCAGGVEYSNFCKATCEGYSEDEITTITMGKGERDSSVIDCSI